MTTEEMFRTVYDAVYGLARRRMVREEGRHTLQPTALVNEAYLRLAADGTDEWSDPRQFYGAAAEVMRRILIDHARGKRASKRGRGERPEPLDDSLPSFEPGHGLDNDELLDLHSALDALEREAPRHALVVKLRFFVGMTIAEIAEALELSVPTINRDWSFARAWLREHVDSGEGLA